MKFKIVKSNKKNKPHENKQGIICGYFVLLKFPGFLLILVVTPDSGITLAAYLLIFKTNSTQGIITSVVLFIKN